MNFKFKENDEVWFEYHIYKGAGRVCGVALSDLPLIGKHYIIELLSDSGINKEEYPFSCISIPEHTMQLLTSNSNIRADKWVIGVSNA